MERTKELVPIDSLEGYENIASYYMCDCDGNIYGKSGKALKPTYYRSRKYNYRGVTLFLKDGKSIHKAVARIIALAFVDGRTTLRNEVDHINGDASDNRAENLRWVSRKENLDFLRLRQYREGTIGRGKR